MLEQAMADVLAALGPHVEEIADSCAEATSSSAALRAACQDTERSVGGLMAQVDESVAELRKVRGASEAATAATTERLLGIAEEIRGSTARVGELVAALDGLSNFVAAIKGIADQTRLLSLNARIEAARAGDHGRSFAVVADHVKDLAATATAEAERVAATIEELKGRAAATSDTITESVGGLDEVGGSLERLHAEQAGHWDAVDARVGATNAGLAHLRTAMQQQVTTVGRTDDDIATIRAIATRVGKLDPRAVRAAGRPQEDVLEAARRRGVLRVGAWTGFRGLNFVNPRTRRLEGLELELLALLGRELGVRVEPVDVAWVDLPKKLRRREFDLLFCALIPDASYNGLAYTRSYLDMGPVVMRRAGDTSITTIADLAGKVVGHIADPAVSQMLLDTGVEFGELRPVYDDDYYDPVVQGTYDAFVIDLPIVHWCATSPDSPWQGKIEVAGKPVDEWIYCAATRDEPASAGLLEAVDRILGEVRASREYARIVERWQGARFDWGKSAPDFLG